MDKGTQSRVQFRLSLRREVTGQSVIRTASLGVSPRRGLHRLTAATGDRAALVILIGKYDYGTSASHNRDRAKIDRMGFVGKKLPVFPPAK